MSFIFIPFSWYCLCGWIIISRWELFAVLWQWQISEAVECETGHLAEDVHWSRVRGFGRRQVIGKCVNVQRKTRIQLKPSSNAVRNIICFNSSYDSSQVCSCSSDKTVILWDVGSGNVTRKLRGHAGVRTFYFICNLSASFSFQILSFAFRVGFICLILLPQKVNCVQFNEEASVILSGETQSVIQYTVFTWKIKTQ